jgi:hypothetical protein
VQGISTARRRLKRAPLPRDPLELLALPIAQLRVSGQALGLLGSRLALLRLTHVRNPGRLRTNQLARLGFRLRVAGRAPRQSLRPGAAGPIENTYSSERLAEFHARLAPELAKPGVAFHDFYSETDYDPTHFYDGDHVNKTGAERFSAELRAWIAQHV